MAEEKKQEQAVDPEETQAKDPDSPVDLSAEPLVDLSDVGHAHKLSPDEDPVALLEAEVASLKDQLLRAMAETENVRRRAQREREDSVRYAAVPVIKDLLGVADNLQRALESVPEDLAEGNEQMKNLRLGVEMTQKELQSVFERHNIRTIDPLGERLDPHLHEAMYEIEDPDKPAGTVVQVVQAGYRLHDRLLRPARVGISKGGAKAAQGQAGQGGGAKPGDSVDTQA
ncbi:MAG: nucleotide exchange factor GrpE [Kiloniellaceae bacterium]